MNTQMKQQLDHIAIITNYGSHHNCPGTDNPLDTLMATPSPSPASLLQLSKSSYFERDWNT